MAKALPDGAMNLMLVFIKKFPAVAGIFINVQLMININTAINFYLSKHLPNLKYSVIICVLWCFAIMGCSNPI